jgi:hypothetical protein
MSFYPNNKDPPRSDDYYYNLSNQHASYQTDRYKYKDNSKAREAAATNSNRQFEAGEGIKQCSCTYANPTKLGEGKSKPKDDDQTTCTCGKSCTEGSGCR